MPHQGGSHHEGDSEKREDAYRHGDAWQTVSLTQREQNQEGKEEEWEIVEEIQHSDELATYENAPVQVNSNM